MKIFGFEEEICGTKTEIVKIIIKIFRKGNLVVLAESDIGNILLQGSQEKKF